MCGGWNPIRAQRRQVNEPMAGTMRGEEGMKMALVALGSNVRGHWGAPREALAMAVRKLGEVGAVEAVSSLWRSVPFGPVAQPSFLNAVLVMRADLSPHAMMRWLFRLENAAGRRRGRSWGPRPLDLDLLDHGGQVLAPSGAGRPSGALELHHLQRRGLVLPHPAIAFRPFVLLPLTEVAPKWRYPLGGWTAEQALARLPGKVRAQCHRIGVIT